MSARHRSEEPPDPGIRVKLARGVVMEFQAIPPGCFSMGFRGQDPAEEPVHRVRIAQLTPEGVARPFYMARTQVTQAQFAAWKPGHENGFPNQPNHPAEEVTWDEAMAFCAWLNEVHRATLPAGYVATLPTEAEWEYACRARTDPTREGGWIITETEYFCGDGVSALEAAGWYAGNSEGGTRGVGLKAANGFGLHDMHGNVWEWCWDARAPDAYKTRVDGVVDPEREDREAFLGIVEALSASKEGNPDRVMRGGSWINTARGCRSAYRTRGWPGLRHGHQGFRVCLVPGPAFAKGFGGAGPLSSQIGEAPGDGARPASAQGFGGAGRDAVAESEGAGTGNRDATDLGRAGFPPRSGGGDPE